jgi:hypothetical protein
MFYEAFSFLLILLERHKACIKLQSTSVLVLNTKESIKHTSICSEQCYM